MLGIDITSISRFKDVKKTFINNVLNRDEIKMLLKSNNKARFLAARWAIKEALFKANSKLSSFKDIKVEKKNNRYWYPGYLISTSTEGDYYIAIVMKDQLWNQK